MFIRLCKMEILSSWRSYCIMYLVLFLASLGIQLSDMFDLSILGIATSISAIIYMATIFALCFSFIFNMVKNYYQSMFGKQAYLTHALPVTSRQLLLSKVVIGVFWIIASIFMILMSLLFSFFVYTTINGEYSVIGLIQAALAEFDDILVFGEIVKGTIYFLNGLTYTVLFFFAILSFVNSSIIRGHRILLAIVIYFGFMFVMSKVEEIGVSILSNIPLDLNIALLGTIGTLLLSVGLFFFNCYILDHKMEVE